MKIIRTVLCGVLVLGLGACVSLFPKTPPAQLYRFGVGQTAAPPAPGGEMSNVMRQATNFPREADTDRILTVDGDQVAYIAEARWESPASMLFDEAETAAFANGPVRLLRPGDAATVSASLRLDVESFEARYENGEKAAPTVIVTVRATLFNAADRRVLGDETFESRKPATDNRVSAIVAAFDEATSDVLGRAAAWTAQQAPRG